MNLLSAVPITHEEIAVVLAPEQAVARLERSVQWGRFVFRELLDAQNGELVGCRRGDALTLARAINY